MQLRRSCIRIQDNAAREAFAQNCFVQSAVKQLEAALSGIKKQVGEAEAAQRKLAPKQVDLYISTLKDSMKEIKEISNHYDVLIAKDHANAKAIHAERL